MTNALEDKFARIFALTSEIRYAAICRDGSPQSREAVGLQNASSAESDKYEELLVNPTLLYLAQQRGNIDCGGAGFIVVGYGNFTQLIVSVRGGHVSVAFEQGSNPLNYVDQVRAMFDESDTLAA